ncbi:hypothetical protein [Corynebacterium epidermidicanis]|uniref:Uncharacterized protein n=1 Tax=Corynebacterium epidermidicanis TaxID=1050174 RepID=A0A0G3GW47_9CORY|nr:hypothetical protein [Corynebacterium epidermidicanis]AKK03733.1 hypothetical protein CEPID_09440 [Corynebacterium epidermidicanis]
MWHHLSLEYVRNTPDVRNPFHHVWPVGNGHCASQCYSILSERVGAEIIGETAESDLATIQGELEAPIRVDLFLHGAPKEYPEGALQRTFNFNPQYETRGALIVASSSAASLIPDTVDQNETRRILEHGGAVVAHSDGRLELLDQAKTDLDGEILITPETAESLGLETTPYGSLFAGGNRISLLDSLVHFNETNTILVRNQHLTGVEPYFITLGAFALVCSLLVGSLLSRSRKVPAIAVSLSTVILVLSQSPSWLPTWELIMWWVSICTITAVSFTPPRFRWGGAVSRNCSVILPSPPAGFGDKTGNHWLDLSDRVSFESKSVTQSKMSQFGSKLQYNYPNIAW